MSLATLLDARDVNATALATHLDALSETQRVAETIVLNGRQQAKLFDVVQGARRFTLDDLAPSTNAPLSGVTHEGRNSMLAFTRFAKVFAVPDDASLAATERWGFNRTSGFVTTAVGPGYFVTVQQGDEVLVDYTRLPPKPLTGAPAILDNASRLSFFVYNRTKDVVRGVSKHVSIGRASRDGKQLDNWFVLCRTGA